MNILSKFLILLSVFLILPFYNISLANSTPPPTTSQGTLLPQTSNNMDVASCKKELQTKLFNKKKEDAIKAIVDNWDTDGAQYLSCGIKTGLIKMWMVPFYIRFMLEFIIQISGLACVAATVYGGFLYLFAGISEDKDKGKKAITYGIIGMVITFLAWAIVNIFILFVSGA